MNQVAANQPGVQGTPLNPADAKADVHPALKRTGQIIGAIAINGALGYVLGYWGTRLIVRLGWLGEEARKVAISPLAYFLLGAASAAMIEAARLTYDVAHAVIGDRQKYENLTPNENSSKLEKFRNLSWRVISSAENAQKDADVIFSRLFGVRTVEEIHDKKIADRDLYFMEVLRREFWAQVHETILTSVPQELSLYLVERIGFTILAAHTFAWLHGLLFVTGIINKVGEVYKRIDAEELAEKRRAQAENKAYCDILEAMYPMDKEPSMKVINDGQKVPDLDDDKPLDAEKNDGDNDKVKVKEGLAKDLTPGVKDAAKTKSDDRDQYPGDLDRRYAFAQKLVSDDTLDEIEDEEAAEIEMDKLPSEIALCEVEG